MSTVALTESIEPAQRTAARIAGLFYLLMLVTSIFAEFFARGPVIVPGDAAKTAGNIAAHELLFRLGTVSNLITYTGDVVLIWALYIVLRPVNRNVAVLAAFWRIAECSVLGVITVNDFAALRLLSGAGYLKTFDQRQLQTLARLFLSVQGSGYLVGLLFFGLGSTVFAWLWLKSRYIPRALAGWGIFSSLVVVGVALAIMVFPSLAAVVFPACFLPILIFEVTMGFWLLLKRI